MWTKLVDLQWEFGIKITFFCYRSIFLSSTHIHNILQFNVMARRVVHIICIFTVRNVVAAR